MPTPVSRTRMTGAPTSLNAVETITCPPGSLNFTALDMRLSMICRSERASASAVGSLSDSDIRMMMRSRAACGCMIADAIPDRLVDVDRPKIQLEFAGFDLGEINQVVGEADDMLARGEHVFQIGFVTFVADRAEALFDHHFGKAENGLQGRADLVADGGQKLCLASICLYRLRESALFVESFSRHASLPLEKNIDLPVVHFANPAKCQAAGKIPAVFRARLRHHTAISSVDFLVIQGAKKCRQRGPVTLRRQQSKEIGSGGDAVAIGKKRLRGRAHFDDPAVGVQTGKPVRLAIERSEVVPASSVALVLSCLMKLYLLAEFRVLRTAQGDERGGTAGPFQLRQARLGLQHVASRRNQGDIFVVV